MNLFWFKNNISRYIYISTYMQLQNTKIINLYRQDACAKIIIIFFGRLCLIYSPTWPVLGICSDPHIIELFTLRHYKRCQNLPKRTIFRTITTIWPRSYLDWAKPYLNINIWFYENRTVISKNRTFLEILSEIHTGNIILAGYYWLNTWISSALFKQFLVCDKKLYRWC